MGAEVDHFEEQMAEGTPPGFDVAARLDWMSRVGIDFALVHPPIAVLNGMSPNIAHEVFPEHDDYQAAVHSCNSYMTDRLGPYRDRLSPVTAIDTDDLDWSIAELERTRASGSRAFWVDAVCYEGRSPSHPAADRIWKAATALGMIGIVHTGRAPAFFGDGWADAGWNESNGSGATGLLRLNNSRRTEAAERLISSLVFGGAFARNPNFTIVLEELRVGWLPGLVQRICDLSSSSAYGAWPYELSPEDCVRRCVRASPLVGIEDEVREPFAKVPEMLVFSSDFPHSEGNLNPIEIYDDLFAEVDDDTRRRFLGENILQCFQRMGDPLITVEPVPHERRSIPS
jgi:predicted TIM-barrel fold metal-dependent hydrolase